MSEARAAVRPLSNGPIFFLFFGSYLSFHGYHSRDNDQAFRLPLLLHRQDPGVFADDPFVRAFDAFNPHRGYLGLLDAASRAVGLSAALAGLYVLTFVVTCFGIDRLGRAAWPEAGPRVGVVAVGLLLAAKAGNVGTNHLFEPILLERLLAMALGWLALAETVGDPRHGRWRAAGCLGIAGWIHPSLGLQLGLLLGGSWLAWACWGRTAGVSIRDVGWGLVATAVAMVPSLAFAGAQGSQLLKGLPPEELRLICAYVQSPQHMVPHLWRWSQWLAWGCYFVLAGLALGEWRGPWPPARRRLVLVLVVDLIGLAGAWVAVEVVGDLRTTLFQPFRMATVARGLALVLLAPRILRVWSRGGIGRARVTVLVVGLVGDWTLIVATGMELAIAAAAGAFGRVGARAGVIAMATDSSDPGRVCETHQRTGGRWCVSHTLLDRRVEVGGPRVPRVPRTEPVPSQGRAARVEDNPWHPRAHYFRVGGRLPGREPGGVPRKEAGVAAVAGGLALLAGLAFLARHDTESGHVRLLLALAGLGAVTLARRGRPLAWTPRRARWVVMAAWVIPAAALLAPMSPHGDWLIRHCRFTAVPIDDSERLAVWCRDHTPPSARFVGPPGPKTFRLWSLRSVAFNRASSPYHAAGLADWAARYRDHVGFQGTTADFVRAYLADRQGLERRYDAMTDAERAALARRQGAGYVIAAPPKDHAATRGPDCPLQLLHVEGRYAVYRVGAATRSAGTG